VRCGTRKAEQSQPKERPPSFNSPVFKQKRQLHSAKLSIGLSVRARLLHRYEVVVNCESRRLLNDVFLATLPGFQKYGVSTS